MNFRSIFCWSPFSNSASIENHQQCLNSADELNSMAFLISDYYESEEFGQHYQDKRSLAYSFLSTMGSKALVLTKLTQSVSVAGLDYEASCAHELIRNRFRIKLCGPVGLLVFKRARNGGLRALQIRLKTCSKVGDHIEWQSKKLFGRRDRKSVV